MKYALFTGLLAIAGVNCRATPKLYHIEKDGEVVERLHTTPEGWNEIGAPSADRKLHFRIAVRAV